MGLDGACCALAGVTEVINTANDDITRIVTTIRLNRTIFRDIKDTLIFLAYKGGVNHKKLRQLPNFNVCKRELRLHNARKLSNNNCYSLI